ncbi:MAG: hypothetical protein GXY85_12405 [Candidatus Brocadiaceae bacterium]|nr:hypothetical protein [Candidatus Brocadiaceae bacterium]
MWTLDEAEREATPTCERISLAGLWRWQPAGDSVDTVPADGWGYQAVPAPWPSGRGQRGGTEGFVRNPAWSAEHLRDVKAAWYQVDLTVPAEWEGRHIALTTEYLHSFASVYVDGRKVADMRWPSGEVDLTEVCRPGGTHVLSMLVLALPLRAVMMSFNDTMGSREVPGQVNRRGLCGDVSLVGAPRGGRIRRLRVETSVRNWQVTFNTALDDVDPEQTYVLHARVSDPDGAVTEFTSDPFGGADVVDGHLPFTCDWHPERLWDIHTPQNQYDVTLSLRDGAGNVLDEALPERFGFREFWIDGRDFYLNGTRIFLSFTRSQPGSDYEDSRARLEERKDMGLNFGACGGFGAAPGDHVSFEGVLRAADDVGVLMALTQPHFRQYDWDAEDAERTNGYAEHAEFYTHVAGNHPSVVFYATSHNSVGYMGSMDPDMIDGIHERRSGSGAQNAANALRAQALVNGLDPTRILYHHAAGNLGVMHTNNFYANFAPIQEMDDWFEHWGTEGVKPLHLNEYGVPYPWDWSMYRGWYKGTRVFGSAIVPWEMSLAEWNAQFYGPTAYRISEEEARNLRWEAARFRGDGFWQRWNYPYDFNHPYEEREGVYSMYFTNNWRAFRTWGLSSNDPSDFLNHTPDAILRNNMPLLAYIAGRPGAFTTKDHNFLPGEAFEKQLIIINNCRETVTAECEWSLDLPAARVGRRTITLPTGEQERIPLAFDLPADLPPGQYALRATVEFSNGERQDDVLPIDVLPMPQPVEAAERIAVFDPKGETAQLLTELGVAFDAVGAGDDPAGYDVLIIGKDSLTPDGPAPDIARVRDGLRVVIFEQTDEVLEKRFGFRIARDAMRWVFPRVPEHPLLEGLADENLWNWRGDATLLPPRGTYEYSYHSPMAKWCGITITERWRCGNRGSVASVLIEKPAAGDFLPVLDCGYALQYAPLLEYREGQGMVLFCQMDVTGRTERDPAAEALARNIVGYASAWEPAERRTVVYAGEDAGRKHLEAAGLEPAAFLGDLTDDQVLVLGPGAGEELGANAADVRGWVQDGGHVLVLGLTGVQAGAFLPAAVTTTPGEHIASYFDTVPLGSPLAGVSPADVHNRDPRELPLVSGGATPVGNGVLGHLEDNVVFFQLPPWQLDYSAGEQWSIKRTFRKASYTVTRLLANMGAAGRTPLLSHVSQPVGDGEQRWLDGLYLDVPEEYDFPYRFFCW